MKTKFNNPEIEIVLFCSSDVILTGASKEDGDIEIGFDDLD